MFRVRRSADRGAFDHGWLQTRHTFSFASYQDPEHMGFSVLRVINEDWIQPGKGFGTHSHREMEIITYMLEGSLEHRDSMGHGAQIRPGEVQRMSAGTGLTHSERNPSDDSVSHLLQIWIEPSVAGVEPAWDQKLFPVEERTDRLRLLVSPDGAEGSLTIHQDVRLFGGLLTAGTRVEHPLAGRRGWVQVASGTVALAGELLAAGDGAAVEGEDLLVLDARDAAEVVFFDLP